MGSKVYLNVRQYACPFSFSKKNMEGDKEKDFTRYYTFCVLIHEMLESNMIMSFLKDVNNFLCACK